MAELPLWGSLQKSQDDSETIEEAIVRIIGDHDDDPEAHNGEGQSLEAHRTEDVLNHPPGSIVPDKISFSDLSFDTTFEDLSGFDSAGSVTASDWPGVILSVEDGGVETSTLKANLLGIIPSGDLVKTLLFDIYFYRDTDADDYDFFAGLCNSAMSQLNLGFRIVDGEIIGAARWSGSEHNTEGLYTPGVGELVFVRVFFDPGDGVLYFYINGVLRGSLQPGAAIVPDNQFAVKVVSNTEESGVFRVYRLTISRGI